MQFNATGKAPCSERHSLIQKLLYMARFTAFLLFAACIQLSAKGWAQHITLSERNAPLEKVISDIQKQSNYAFFYDHELLQKGNPVTIHLNRESILEALQQIFNNQPLTYKLIGDKIITITERDIHKNVDTMITPLDTLKIIQGKVTNEVGEPIVGASVRVKGGSEGTVTDVQGNFNLTISRNATLVVSYLGYTPKEISVMGRSLFDISLSAATTGLNQLVVVGYGKQKKVNVTGSVSTVSGETLTSTPVSNVSNMLIGNTPGLSGVQSSGEPGRNAATIHIRGISTFYSQDPLVVIDGIQQPAEHPFDQLNNMDANEIDNISVLKDATATAVYGIRGANGVIVVTTKRGKIGKPKLSLATNFGFTKATAILKTVNSYEYAVMRNEAIRSEISSFGNVSYEPYLFSENDLWKFKHNRDYTPAEVAAMTNLTESQKTALNASPAIYYGSNDWMQQQFGGTGLQKQLNLNITGGTQKVKYFASLGYFSQGSILNNTSYHGSNTESTFDRYNFRSNFDIDVVKNLKLSINLAGQFGTTSGPGASMGNPYDLEGRYGTIMQFIYESNPYMVPGILDGHLVNYYAGIAGSASNPLGLKTGSSLGIQNAVFNLLASGSETLFNTLFSNSISLHYDMDYITPGLSAHATVNYDDEYVKTASYFPSLPTYSVRRNLVNPNKLDFFNGQVTANAFYSDAGHNSVWNKIYYEAGLNYNRTFGPHTISALLLGTAQKYSLPSDEYNTPSGLMGFVGRGTYNYKERYLAEFDMGYNGTEQFIEGRRFGFFPAYSAGWVISNESFFPQNRWVNYLKFRGSYGEVGNDQLNIGGVTRRYLYLPSTFNVNQGGYWFGNSDGSVTNPYYTGSTEGKIGNPLVTWERAKKVNVGIDVKFLDSRLSLSMDVFKENRNNILTDIETIPAVYGVAGNSVPPANVGRTTNRGYEFVLHWEDRIGDFHYYLGANINYAKNKILYKAEAPNPYPWMNQTGFAIGQYKGLVSDGFFNTQKELNNRPYNMYTGNRATLGDIRYKDIDGDGLIDNKDMVPIGYPNLPEYSYNLRLGFNYKGFDLSMLFVGSAHGSFYIDPKIAIPFFKNAGNAFQWEYDGRWTPEKAAEGKKITYPRAQMAGSPNDNNFLTSDFWLISNDFKRLKNLEVGYTLPGLEFLQQMKISSIHIYLNGNNLITWGNTMKDIDPELRDMDSPYIYPLTRVFNFGANIQF